MSESAVPLKAGERKLAATGSNTPPKKFPPSEKKKDGAPYKKSLQVSGSRAGPPHQYNGTKGKLQMPSVLNGRNEGKPDREIRKLPTS